MGWLLQMNSEVGMGKARGVLKSVFGFGEFRPLQEEVVKAVLDGEDSLVLMPTGGGKSICYQVPALVMDGVTVVVSPLISLMRDQVGALRQNGVRAAFLNSSLSGGDAKKVVGLLTADKLKLLYVAPERLMLDGFLEILKKARVSLFAIDEAHCISTWGHSFRKEYTQLGRLREIFPKVPMMALTATADEVTREDILKQLNIDSARRFVASFDRPNIVFRVLPASNRARSIVELVRSKPNESGIVYCLSRKSTEKMAERLRMAGLRAEHYHANLSSEDRSRVQEEFLRDELQVVCATVAFGMGIDKSNVRYVIHHNMPSNVEGYYQEVGRAGRDGLESEAVLYYSPADMMQWRRMILNDEMDEQQQRVKMKKLYEMQNWAELMRCRRKFILDYFDEETGDECGGCDVCLEPPEDFDGTEVAQKVLSVLARVKKPLSSWFIVSILRESKAQVIFDNGYDKIKTYGAGNNIAAPAWRQYIQQMMDLGLMRYSREDNGLAMTSEGEEVLYGRKKVKLKKSSLEKGGKVRAVPVKKVDDTDYDKELFEKLRRLRSRLADEQGVPPYIVFSDATLRQMSVIKPKSKSEMLSVSGVGEVKWERYGTKFLEAIKDGR